MGIYVRVTRVYFYLRNSDSIPINYEIYSLEAYLVAIFFPFTFEILYDDLFLCGVGSERKVQISDT
jgi:hypothetical protein